MMMMLPAALEHIVSEGRGMMLGGPLPEQTPPIPLLQGIGSHAHRIGHHLVRIILSHVSALLRLIGHAPSGIVPAPEGGPHGGGAKPTLPVHEAYDRVGTGGPDEGVARVVGVDVGGEREGHVVVKEIFLSAAWIQDKPKPTHMQVVGSLVSWFR